MNDLRRRAVGAAIALLMTMTAVLLSGCGPGGGGTGTGEGAMYTGTVSLVGPAGTPGGAAPIELQVAEGATLLRAQCGYLVFRARGAIVGQDVSLPGELTIGASTTAAVLRLQYEAPSASNAVNVQITDTAGLLLLGPVTLVESPQGSACP